jgi:WD40 repeat protein
MTLTETESIDIGARVVSPLMELTEHQLPANITAAAIIPAAGPAAFALGDGTVRVYEIGDADGKPAFSGAGTVAVRHTGAATALKSFLDGLVSAGQDGKVFRHLPTLEAPLPVIDFAGRWINALAVHNKAGRIAAAADRSLIVADQDGQTQCAFSDFPSTISGLSFDPEGRRIAAAHVDGISILSVDKGEQDLRLDWKGSHIGVSWSPDGRYVVSATQERELHVWDLVTLQDLRMGGYPHKIHGLGWLTDGPFLICTGADVITAWSFADAGPAGKPPIEIGYVYNGLVTAVAANPVRALIAGGYSTGSLLLGGVVKGEALLARASQSDAITGLAWAPDGCRLIAGTAAGTAIIVDVPDDLSIR